MLPCLPFPLPTPMLTNERQTPASRHPTPSSSPPALLPAHRFTTATAFPADSSIQNSSAFPQPECSPESQKNMPEAKGHSQKLSEQRDCHESMLSISRLPTPRNVILAACCAIVYPVRSSAQHGENSDNWIMRFVAGVTSPCAPEGLNS